MWATGHGCEASRPRPWAPGRGPQAMGPRPWAPGHGLPRLNGKRPWESGGQGPTHSTISPAAMFAIARNRPLAIPWMSLGEGQLKVSFRRRIPQNEVLWSGLINCSPHRNLSRNLGIRAANFWALLHIFSANGVYIMHLMKANSYLIRTAVKYFSNTRNCESCWQRWGAMEKNSKLFIKILETLASYNILISYLTHNRPKYLE